MVYVVDVVAALAVILVVAWIGVKVQPRSFPAYTQRTPELRSIALPAGLPAPVERFYRAKYGEQIPVIESAVVTGQAMMRPAGPVRYRTSKSPEKTLWLSHALPEQRQGDKVILGRGAVIWMDDGKPWFVMTTEDTVFNVDVQQYIRATGL